MTRYFLPSLLTIQLVVAYWLGSSRNRFGITKIISVALILVLGFTSCLVSSQEFTWWNKINGYRNLAIAKAINNYSQPLVITNNKMNQESQNINVGDFVSISHLLDSKVSVLLFKDQNVPVIESDRFSDILLWNVGAETIANFNQRNNCELGKIEADFYPDLWIMRAKNS